jgi:hypothetical protein
LSSVIDAAFRLSLVMFLLLGCVMVILQVVGVLGLSSGLVIGAAQWFGPPAFIAAGLTGVLAYALSYLRRDSAATEEEA